MRIFFQPTRQYAGSPLVLTIVAPSDVTVLDTLGAVMEADIGYTVDGDGDYYAATTDALYVANQKYVLRITATTGLGVVTENHPFRHVTGVVSGAPTLPVTLSSPSLAAGGTGASFTLTLPTDPNRASVILIIVPSTSGAAAITSTSTTAAIASGTLLPVTSYYAIAIPVSAGGDYGPIAQGSVRRFTTLGTTHAYTKPDEVAPDLCLVVNTRINSYDSYQADGPHYRDLADVDGSQSIQVGSDIRAVGQGREFEYRITCCDPVVFRERGIVFRMRQRTEGPRGTQERSKV